MTSGADMSRARLADAILEGINLGGAILKEVYSGNWAEELRESEIWPGGYSG